PRQHRDDIRLSARAAGQLKRTAPRSGSVSSMKMRSNLKPMTDRELVRFVRQLEKELVAIGGCGCGANDITCIAGCRAWQSAGGITMSLDRLINLLVTIAVVELMVLTGLKVTLAEIARRAGDWRLLARAALANYLLVPALAIVLLLLFDAAPMVAAGFLV